MIKSRVAHMNRRLRWREGNKAVKDEEVKELRHDLGGGPPTWRMMSPKIMPSVEMDGRSGMQMQ